MKQITNLLAREYTYESKEERLIHVAKMEEQGWTCTGAHRFLKDRDRARTGIYDRNATKDDYEWYARFTRPHKMEKTSERIAQTFE